LKYDCMYEYRSSFHIARMAKVLQVSVSGYYKWIRRRNAPPTEKDLSDQQVSERIEELFRKSKGSFGIRKVTSRLRESQQINHKRVERLMKKRGLFSKTSRQYIVTTDSDHDEPIAENLLNRDFHAERPNEKMVSDTTVIMTAQGRLYVAAILDLYGRIPVGMAMSRTNDRFLVMEALKDMEDRGCGKPGCIVHSDRGSTYASKEYRQLLEHYGLVCSMSRKGDCWDNAPMESFWGKMKGEWLKPRYKRINDAVMDVYEYVWDFYPTRRPHEALGYATPKEVYLSK